MALQTWTLFDESQRSDHSQVALSPPETQLPAEWSTRRGLLKFQWRQIEHGPGAGVDVLSVSGTHAGFIVLPTRGMSLWRCWNGQVEYGWKSPVQGPVHPKHVPLYDPSGLGWLEGFDEFLVRCGLESNGAPEFDEHHRVRWPLHGRVGNLAANRCTVTVNNDEGWVEVTGVVRETRLFFAHLVMTSTVRMYADGHVLEIHDRVTNAGERDGIHQMLYHINFGKPVLDAGTQLLVAAKEVAPRNAHAATDIGHWDTYRAPQAGYEEQVYFFKPSVDADGWSRAMAVNTAKSAAVGVEYDTRTLPWFIQWKNTAAEADGYVTGLEPATNFPNVRSFEEEHGRIVRLKAGAHVDHRLRIHLLATRGSIDEFARSIQPRGGTLQVHATPRPEWSKS